MSEEEDSRQGERGVGCALSVLLNSDADATAAVMSWLSPEDLSAFLCTCRSTAALAPVAWKEQLAVRRRALGLLPSVAQNMVPGTGELAVPVLRRAVAGLSPRRRLEAIALGRGWAVHAIVLRYADGTLTGSCMENDGTPVPLEESALAASNRVRKSDNGDVLWHRLEPEEYVTAVSGTYTQSQYLCHRIAFRLSSGRVISCVATNNTWVSTLHFELPVPSADAGGRLLGILWDSGFKSGVRAISTDRPV
eukprot:CAMPEP_0177758840 /NCGR_PEP_ID=MMETSP0491_2-20121128/4405_1 /TAXON_ID=63592 /ORGANISM="Tetraselmis chuii, Strain PLY429" /LENGTH=249 /DNA_ID=CAMNT_0019274613 /DNA_START=27 /DNA_END=776 /DNA_ORIENTATION=+